MSLAQNSEGELGVEHAREGSDALAASRLPDSIQVAAVCDSPTQEDLLGFKPYVDALARFLISPHTRLPLTISIEGPWGSGKSSFMQQLEAALARTSSPRQPPLVVRFNAWRHDKDEALWAAFATTCTDQLEAQRPWWRRKLGRLSLGWDRVKHAPLMTVLGWLGLCLFIIFVALKTVSYASAHLPQFGSGLDEKKNLEVLLSCLGPLGAVVAIVTTALGQVMKILGNPLKTNLKKYLQGRDYESSLAFIEIFHRDFKKTLRAFAGQARVFVFVDDLDRCDVPRAADLMQALSLLIAEDSQIVFILGMDREKVAAGIAHKFKDVIPYLHRDDGRGTGGVESQLRYGHEFLEKFLQIVFPLPLTSKDALDRFIEGLAHVALARPRRHWLVEQVWQLREFVWGRQGHPDRPAPPVPALPGSQRDGLQSTITEDKANSRVFRTLGFEADSERIQRIVRTVAPFLDRNPRRIKQFLNLLRLRAYIALETGLLDTVGGKPSISLEHIGKVAAISMRWPEFLEDWRKSPALVAALESKEEPSTADGKRWAMESGLVALLRDHLGCSADRAMLSAVPVEEVLKASPAVPRPTGTQVFSRSLLDLALRYERVRASMPAGAERTLAMNGVFSDMEIVVRSSYLDRTLVDSLFASLPDGQRLLVLAAFPAFEPGHASIVIDAILRSHTAFEQFHALRAAERGLPSLNPKERTQLRNAIQASRSKWQEDSTRNRIASTLLKELNRDGHTGEGPPKATKKRRQPTSAMAK
jgi:hypothetical protein